LGHPRGAKGVAETNPNGGSSRDTGAYEAVQIEDSGEDFDLYVDFEVFRYVDYRSTHYSSIWNIMLRK
jgi:hypothetical protein